jgi:hypothetical protein
MYLITGGTSGLDRGIVEALLAVDSGNRAGPRRSAAPAPDAAHHRAAHWTTVQPPKQSARSAPVRTDEEALTFDSAPGGRRLDPFPAKTTVRFEHGLGQVPLLPQILLAFGPEGTNGAGGGSVAIAAGNEALITCMDAHVIEVKNDTCESGSSFV